MNNKSLLLTTIAFFLLVTVSDYWVWEMGMWILPITLFLVIVFMVLLIKCFFQLAKAKKEKFSNPSRNWTFAVSSILLVLIFLWPQGMINFEKLEGENILVAHREGLANCMSTIQLKPNATFKLRNVCFGLSEFKGKYEYKNDTIFYFVPNASQGHKPYYEYGTVQEIGKQGKKILIQYQSRRDTTGVRFEITKNKLLKYEE